MMGDQDWKSQADVLAEQTAQMHLAEINDAAARIRKFADRMAVQAKQMRLAEIEEAIGQVRKLVADHGLTPEQVFGEKFAARDAEGWKSDSGLAAYTTWHMC